MKPSLLATTLAALTSITSASPIEERAHLAYITFYGAADAFFSLDFPTDGSPVQITDVLSISKITSTSDAVCHFKGVDGSFTQVVGQQTVDVGPPQTQVWGSCWKMQLWWRALFSLNPLCYVLSG
ncbi:hypothetical protein BJX63DRAFT_62574 [Aspergillus granulosus]|uniref:Uncharacterized protein n=1 Tax=Aspergillus granulosus TaxID=176169 RepID=A0ABR4GXC8_9EURO